jgi:predicted lipid-binding transport protein (Tim44 family)
MQAIFDPVNLVLAGLAIFIFWRLRSVLGTRTGNERSAREIFLPEAKSRSVEVGDRTIDVNDDVERGRPVPQRPVWTDIAPEGSSLALNLEEIRKADQFFDGKAFLGGAKIAYEMIVEAFAKGDKAALRKLLSPEVLDGFSKVIDARAKDGQKFDFRFIGFEQAQIRQATMVGSTATIDVRFVTQVISTTYDKAGAMIDGDPQAVREVADLWSFERDVTQKDPNWRVVATETLE